MAEKKQKPRHLGRGLDSLLRATVNTAPKSDILSDSSTGVPFPPDEKLKSSLKRIPLKEIRPNPYQPRKTWNQTQLYDLAQSIKENGVIQPIIVRNVGTYYEIIAGERRLRASDQAGLEPIPAVVREADNSEMLELALVENIHRANLNPIEKAKAYKSYIETFSLTQNQAAQRLGLDRSVVANYIRLLDLPQEVRQLLVDGSLQMGHARAILALPTDTVRRKMAEAVRDGKLSVRQVEQRVRKLLAPAEDESQETQTPTNLIDLETRLQSVLGTKVQIKTRKNAKRGRIIIEFYSLDEFDKLTEKMGLPPAERI